MSGTRDNTHSALKFGRHIDNATQTTAKFVRELNVIKTLKYIWCHDDVIKWKHFPRNWPFVREIHRSPVNFPHKGQWRGALMFSLIYAWINDWVNNREAGDLRRQHGHYDVIVMAILKTLHGADMDRVRRCGLLRARRYDANKLISICIWNRCIYRIVYTKCFFYSFYPFVLVQNNILAVDIWKPEARGASPIIIRYFTGHVW